MKFFLILTIALLPQAANAAEIKMPVRVKIVRMVTPEERKAACAEGYSLACRPLRRSDRQQHKNLTKEKQDGNPAVFP